MSMDKAIEKGKEHRRPYKGAKAVDHTCRNHGGCDWCRENRKYRNNKKMVAASQAVKEYTENHEAFF